jgi:hypothetical protein
LIFDMGYMDVLHYTAIDDLQGDARLAIRCFEARANQLASQPESGKIIPDGM